MSKTYDDAYPGKMTDEQIKKKLVQESIKEEKYNFPTEIIDLPSKGIGYSKDNELSSGQIEMKYMTAKEEDILTSANLIRKGTVLDKLFQSLIVSPINYNDLLIGDKNAIMIAARILGYGKNYTFELICPQCQAKNKIDVDLSALENTEFDEEALAMQGTDGYIEYELPNSKRKITFKIPTHLIEEKVRKEMDARRKVSKNGVNPEITTRLKHMIVSVDDNEDKKYITNFVDNEFLSRDSYALREYINTVQPDVNFNIDFECSECDHTATLALPIDAGFFWPKSNQ